MVISLSFWYWPRKLYLFNISTFCFKHFRSWGTWVNISMLTSSASGTSLLHRFQHKYSGTIYHMSHSQYCFCSHQVVLLHIHHCRIHRVMRVCWDLELVSRACQSSIEFTIFCTALVTRCPWLGRLPILAQFLGGRICESWVECSPCIHYPVRSFPHVDCCLSLLFFTTKSHHCFPVVHTWNSTWAK